MSKHLPKYRRKRKRVVKRRRRVTRAKFMRNRRRRVLNMRRAFMNRFRRLIRLLFLRRRLFKIEEVVDNRSYVIGSGFVPPSSLASVDYELLRNNSSSGTGTLYLLIISTGKLFTVTHTTDSTAINARWWSLGYADLYLMTSSSNDYYAISSEVVGVLRPGLLYAPSSSGTNPVIWTLT